MKSDWPKCGNIYVTIMLLKTINLFIQNIQHIYKCQWGSKWHITNQCVYIAFRTIVLFGVLFPKKHVFPKDEFSNEMFWNFLYIVFIVAPICHICFYNQIWRNMIFWKCTNFARFCVLSWNFFIISNHTTTC